MIIELFTIVGTHHGASTKAQTNNYQNGRTMARPYKKEKQLKNQITNF